tara:strand:- start:1514 stop:3817 length:2304 start_codon:yes stop_codon:yes gene_type:complete
MNGNDRFLNVNDAHLRVTGGNVHASSFNLDQISITTTSTTASTIDFLNETKAFNARSNIEVGTANLFVDTTTSNVGIHTSSPEYALDVHGPANVSVLTANTVTGFDGTLFLGSHLLPTQHQQFDIGSAENKIRHLFLSDNSLWIGDETKISFVDQKLKFLKRNKNIVPTGTDALGGNATDAVAHAGVTEITDMKLEHWLAYTKSLTGGADKDIKDIFTDATANYEATSASDAFKEHGNDIYSVNKLRLGSAAAADATLDVVGTIKVTQSLTVSDASSTSILGQAAIGWNTASGDTNMASFAQKDNNTGTNFALKQSAGGLTFINAPSNKSIRFQIAGQEKARFDTNGQLGIGTTDPATKLHVEHYGSAVGDFEGIRIANHATDLHGTSRPAYEFVVSDIDTGTGIGASKFAIGYRGTTSASRTDRLVIDGNGNVGINETNPVSNLHVKDDTSTARIFIQRASEAGECNLSLSGYHSGGSTEWQMYHLGQTSALYFWRGVNRGYLSYNASNNSLNFTGQHRTFIKDTPFTQAETLEGLIVSSNQNKYIRMSGGIEAGSNAVTINEALPVVTVSSTPRDKKCFGVISLSEDPETREEKYGNFTSIMEKEDGDTRIYINSVGEGGIWVSNTNGTLEAGDYITTSALPGYGMKQDDDLLHNYTVAKITMDCDFNPSIVPIQKIKKIQGIKRYWRSSSGEETTEEKEGFDELIEREELVNDLDEHGQIQWEDHSTETEKAYKIRYLDADGNITDEASAVHIAAFVGCTYHCG